MYDFGIRIIIIIIIILHLVTFSTQLLARFIGRGFCCAAQSDYFTVYLSLFAWLDRAVAIVRLSLVARFMLLNQKFKVIL